jgi:hypothetical protein
MKREIQIGYMNHPRKYTDTVLPKIVISNNFLKNAGFSVSDKAVIEYLSNQIIITKVTKTI